MELLGSPWAAAALEGDSMGLPLRRRGSFQVVRHQRRDEEKRCTAETETEAAENQKTEDFGLIQKLGNRRRIRLGKGQKVTSLPERVVMVAAMTRGGWDRGLGIGRVELGSELSAQIGRNEDIRLERRSRGVS